MDAISNLWVVGKKFRAHPRRPFATELSKGTETKTNAQRIQETESIGTLFDEQRIDKNLLSVNK